MKLKRAIINLRAIMFPEWHNAKRIKYLDAIIEHDVRIYREAQIINGSKDLSKIKIGKGTHVLGLLHVFNNCGQILIGENCYIGESTRIYSAARIVIGNHVQLAHGINIFDNNIHSLSPEERKVEFTSNLTRGLIRLHNLNEKEVIIHDNVWVGAGAFIMKGVTIGENAIIGAGSVVVNDVPANAIVAGNPARFIREIPLK